MLGSLEELELRYSHPITQQVFIEDLDGEGKCSRNKKPSPVELNTGIKKKVINRWIQVQSLIIINIWKAIKWLKGEEGKQHCKGAGGLMEGCRKASRQRCECEPGSPKCLRQRLRRACSSWRK